MKPSKAIKLEEVPLVTAYAKNKEASKEKPLPEDGLYLCLLQPREERSDHKTCD